MTVFIFTSNDDDDCPIDNESLVEINAQENNDNIRDEQVVDTELRGKCSH